MKNTEKFREIEGFKSLVRGIPNECEMHEEGTEEDLEKAAATVSAALPKLTAEEINALERLVRCAVLATFKEFS